MDLFEGKNIKPMLIAETQEAFDNPDYIYELKLVNDVSLISIKTPRRFETNGILRC